MGAQYFIQSITTNADVETAFAELSQEALIEYGADPYNGTISTTGFCGIVPGEAFYVDDSLDRHQELIDRFCSKWETRAVPFFAAKQRWSERVETRTVTFRVPIDEPVKKPLYPADVTPELIGKHSRVNAKNVKKVVTVETRISKWETQKSAGAAGKRQYEIRLFSSESLWVKPHIEHADSKAEATKRLNALLRKAGSHWTNATITPVYEPVTSITRAPVEHTVTAEIEYAKRLPDVENPEQIGWAFIVGAAE